MSQHATLFERHRRRLHGLAYRMLGSVGEAEDAVQDTYLRWHGQSLADLRSPEAWLVTACTRICIDRLRAAKVERAAYTGPWLPEPVLAAEADFEVELAESLSLAFLLVLERLSPAERAAYLLRQAFDYDYPEIAAILGKSEAACRQLVSRAQKHVQADRPRFGAAERQHQAAARERARDLAQRFAQAAASGDAAAFAGLLAQDAMIWSDGGGKARAALNVIHGADRCARFFAGIAGKQPAGQQSRFCHVNGQPGFVVYQQGQPVSVFSFGIEQDRICAIFVVRNPDKLARLEKLH